jgi:hypothetical protein
VTPPRKDEEWVQRTETHRHRMHPIAVSAISFHPPYAAASTPSDRMPIPCLAAQDGLEVLVGRGDELQIEVLL